MRRQSRLRARQRLANVCRARRGRGSRQLRPAEAVAALAAAGVQYTLRNAMPRHERPRPKGSDHQGETSD